MDAGGGDPYEQYNERRVTLSSSVLLPKLETLLCLQKKWYLDVRQTPCARSALIYGILGGLTVGGLWFAKSGWLHQPLLSLTPLVAPIFHCHAHVIPLQELFEGHVTLLSVVLQWSLL